MGATLEELKSTVSGLPVPERAELAHYLLLTLESANDGTADDWLAIAERRVNEIRTGQVTGIPAEQVIESLRRPRP